MNALLPPAMLGLVGGGQLGRMFGLAAKTMGYRLTVLEPEKEAPALWCADVHLCAPYNDVQALRTLSETCVAVTTEFENIDADVLAQLAASLYVSPSAASVAILQDRIAEKAYLQSAGFTTAPYRVVRCAQDLAGDLSPYLPGLLKTARLGYDGKGQRWLDSAAAAHEAFLALGSRACVLEKKLDLKLELSVMVARSSMTQRLCYPVAENQHKNGILDSSIVPARISAPLANRVQQEALRLAESLDYIGVLGVEFFYLADHTLVVNEVAPRPHNSGHYTLDACLTNQFQQQLRAMARLPLGDPTLFSPAVMVNILGECWPANGGEPDWLALMSEPNIHLHLYGKHPARPGRKMGHFTVLSPQIHTALQQANAIKNALYSTAGC